MSNVPAGSSRSQSKCRHDWQYDEFHSVGKGAFVRGWRCIKCKKFKGRKWTR